MIVETRPKCTINATLDNTVEGDGVRLTCVVKYNGTNKASMVWKGVEDDPAAVENGITINRSFSVVASAPEIPSFSCIISFEINDEYTNLATNIPVITCKTPAIKVLCKYFIHEVNIQ